MRPRLAPAAVTARPEIVIVRPYERPRQVGMILLPDTSLRDATSSFYEVVCAGNRTADIVGAQLRPDDIVKLPRLEATVDLGHDDEEGRPLLAVHAKHIQSVNRWKEEDDDGAV